MAQPHWHTDNQQQGGRMGQTDKKIEIHCDLQIKLKIAPTEKRLTPYIVCIKAKILTLFWLFLLEISLLWLSLFWLSSWWFSLPVSFLLWHLCHGTNTKFQEHSLQLKLFILFHFQQKKLLNKLAPQFMNMALNQKSPFDTLSEKSGIGETLNLLTCTDITTNSKSDRKKKEKKKKKYVSHLICQVSVVIYHVSYVMGSSCGSQLGLLAGALTLSL